MKGLFCVLPTSDVYNFAAYGLAAQCPAGSKDADFTYDRADFQSRLFTMPWSSSSYFESSILPRNGELRATMDSIGTAAKLTSTPNANLILRFSRLSLISTMSNYTSEDAEKGVFLALCRVLTVRQKNIEGKITDESIQQARLDDIDSIYSSEMYVIATDFFCSQAS